MSRPGCGWPGGGADEADKAHAAWCGMACFRDGTARPGRSALSPHELAMNCRAYGAYTDEPGRPRGLIYQPFVDSRQ